MATKKKEADPGKKPAISYWSKEKCVCPICKKAFEHEIMRSGNGRMIAGSLTEELHRNFEPSAKYGRVYPLIYEVGACPFCYSAFFWNDFTEKITSDDGDKIFEHSDRRKKACEAIFPYFNLKKERSLLDGTAMYYLALMTYDDMGAYALPTMKKAIIALRLAWLTKEMNQHCAGHNYDVVSKLFYSKALFFYQQAVFNETVQKKVQLCLIWDQIWIKTTAGME